jgi:hypothetical protein
MGGKNKTPGDQARGEENRRFSKNSRRFSAPGRAANNDAANRAEGGGTVRHEEGGGKEAMQAMSIPFFRR